MIGTRALLACLPRLRELPNFDEVTFMRISGTALLFLSRLPHAPEEVDAVQIKKVMDAVMQSISTPSAGVPFADRLTRGDDWYWFARFLETVNKVKVAHWYTSLFPDNMVESLESCVSSCPPDNMWHSQIQSSTKELKKQKSCVSSIFMMSN